MSAPGEDELRFDRGGGTCFERHAHLGDVLAASQRKEGGSR
jgi:arylamine N-acetyltransferase